MIQLAIALFLALTPSADRPRAIYTGAYTPIAQRCEHTGSETATSRVKLAGSLIVGHDLISYVIGISGQGAYLCWEEDLMTPDQTTP